MIELKNLKKVYKIKKNRVEALKGINVTFPNNGLIFITGKSGCGKSTLLHLLGALDNYDEGDIIIDNKKMSSLNEKELSAFRNDYLGFIFQDINLLSQFSVEDNIAFSLKFQNHKFSYSLIDDILKKVDLEGYGKRKVDELSGGQKQRVAIARALIKKPKLLLCDEPTGALDSENSENIFRLLKEISKDTLVVVVSHDKESAFKYGDRVITLKDGLIIDDTNKETFIEYNNKVEFNNHKIKGNVLSKFSFRFFRRKPIRLFLALLMIITSLSLFSFANSFSNNDKNTIIAESMKNNGAKYIGFSKRNWFLSEHNNVTGDVLSLLNDSDIDRFNCRFGISPNIVYPYFGGKIQNLGTTDDKLDKFYSNNIEGFMEINNEVLNKYNLTLIGNLPTSDDEIVISRYYYEIFRKYGYRNLNKSCTINSEEDLIGNILFAQDGQIKNDFKIVGIVDTHFNSDRYFNINDTDIEENLYSEYSSSMNYSLHNILFMNPGYFDRQFKTIINDSVIQFSKRNNNQCCFIENYEKIYSLYRFSSNDIDKVTYIDAYKKEGAIIPLSKFIKESHATLVKNGVNVYAYDDGKYNLAKIEYEKENGDSSDFTKGKYYSSILYNNYYDSYLKQGNEEYFYQLGINSYINKFLSNDFETTFTIEYYFNKYLNKNPSYEIEFIGFYNDLDNPVDYISYFLTDKPYFYFKDCVEKNIREYKYLVVPTNEKMNKLYLDYIDETFKEDIIVSNNLNSYAYTSYEFTNEYLRNYINNRSVADDFQLSFKIISYILLGLSIALIYFYFSGVIYETQKEIGILSAMGLCKKDIAKIYVFGNIGLSLIISIFSILISFNGCLIINSIFIEKNMSLLTFIQYSYINILYIVSAAFGSLVIGTFIPLFKQISKKPVDIIYDR